MFSGSAAAVQITALKSYLKVSWLIAQAESLTSPSKIRVIWLCKYFSG